MKTAKPTPISAAPGYDNQPNFSADGNRILFAANRDGKQIDVFVFDRAERPRHAADANRRERKLADLCAGRRRSLPAVSASSSPSSIAGATGQSHSAAVAFQCRGQVTAIDPRRHQSGGLSRLDGRRSAGAVRPWAQGKPATLQIASVKTGKAEIVADNIGRSLHRIPGTRLASFVQREASGEFWIKQIDITTKKIDPLVKAAEGSSDRDMAWMPDGKTILMSAGTKILSWTRGAAGWTEVFDAAPHQLGAITRLAVSPKGDAVAIVVAEPKK